MATKKKSIEFFTKGEVVEALRLQIGAGSRAEFAKRLGITPQLLCDVLGKRRQIPVVALEALGLEKVEQLYRRKVGVEK